MQSNNPFPKIVSTTLISQKDILLTQMAEQTRQLKEQIARITNLFREMVESSISIEEIEEELKNYPPGMAWDMLAHLNNDLSWNPVWRILSTGWLLLRWVRWFCSARLTAPDVFLKHFFVFSPASFIIETDNHHKDDTSAVVIGPR